MMFSSKVHFFQLHRSALDLEDRVFKHVHDVLCGTVEVVLKLFLANHAIGNRGRLVFRVLLQPSQKLLVFFLSLEGIEDICLLAKKTIDWGIRVRVAWSVTHVFCSIILMFIKYHFEKTINRPNQTSRNLPPLFKGFHTSWTHSSPLYSF